MLQITCGGQAGAGMRSTDVTSQIRITLTRRPRCARPATMRATPATCPTRCLMAAPAPQSCSAKPTTRVLLTLPDSPASGTQKPSLSSPCIATVQPLDLISIRGEEVQSDCSHFRPSVAATGVLFKGAHGRCGMPRVPVRLTPCSHSPCQGKKCQSCARMLIQLTGTSRCR